MADLLVIGFWFIIISSIIAGTVESLLFFISIEKMGKIAGMRKSLSLIFISSIITISFSILISIFGLVKYSINNTLWIIVPLSFVLIGINAIPITKFFKKSMEEIEKKGIEKIRQEELKTSDS